MILNSGYNRVCLAHQVLKESKELQEVMLLKDLKGFKVLKVVKALKVLRVVKALKV